MTTRIDTGHCGVTVDSAKTGYVVTDVIDHSPARYSEIKTGDTLLVIEGESCEGVTALRMQQLLKGAQGTTKTIRLARKDSILTRKLLMDTFFWPSVFYDSLSETTARIRIETFAYNTEHDSGTFGEFYHALDTAAWASNIIIDLRGNRGGYLWQCFKTLEPFVSSGNPFIRFRIWEFDTTTFTGEAIDTLIRATDPRWANAQCYMLVDSSTASASELFVAALRENRTNALTIGSSTFGKASGWTYAETPRSAIATITTLSITPVHEPSYDSVGIRPDIVIGEDEDALQVALSRIGVSAAAKRLAHSQRALRPVGAPAHAGPDGLIVEPMFFSR
jgi:carboxyl-terminal processing protease